MRHPVRFWIRMFIFTGAAIGICCWLTVWLWSLFDRWMGWSVAGGG